MCYIFYWYDCSEFFYVRWLMGHSAHYSNFLFLTNQTSVTWNFIIIWRHALGKMWSVLLMWRDAYSVWWVWKSLSDGKCVVISHVVVELSERIRQFSRRHVIVKPLWRPVRGCCRNVPVEDGNNNTEHCSFVMSLKCCIFLFVFFLIIYSFRPISNV